MVYATYTNCIPCKCNRQTPCPVNLSISFTINLFKAN